MLPGKPTYEEIFEDFEWKIPEYFNMGSAICQLHSSNGLQNNSRKTALIHWYENGENEVHTYDELHRKSNQLANGLAGLGLKYGDRVAIILPQSLQTVLSHIAVYKSGAIAVPLARLFGAQALAYRLKHSGAKIVITNRENLAKISTVRSELPELEVVILIDGETDEEVYFDKLVDNASSEFEAANTKADTPALIIYTSGTTGPPKGALHAHRVLLGHIPGIQVHHEFLPQPGDIAWTPADWAWAGGLLNILLPCLYMGVPVVYGGMHRFDPHLAFQLMADTKTTSAFIPPTALRFMKSVEKPGANYNLNLRTIGSGGESLGASTCKWVKEELGLDVNEFYGQTECNLVLSGFGARGVSLQGSIGKPVPGYEVTLINKEGMPCKQGQSGEVAIKKPNPIMFLEYWRDPDATANKFNGDWMLTGDQCIVDEQGYYHFVGRDDDIISSAGFRLGPGEIEDCLNSHPAVRIAVAVAKPDELRGDIVKAYIALNEEYLKDTTALNLTRDIQLHVKARLAANIYPREIEIVDDIPLTTTGKVIRRFFRQKAKEEAEQEV